MDAQQHLAAVRQRLTGEPVFIAGSLVASVDHGLNDSYSDVDIFCPTFEVLVSVTRGLLDTGFTFDDRNGRVWARWLRYGVKKWHTNSLRINSPEDIEYNLVYKLADGHPTTSLSQVLESFDFGLLGVGIEAETDTLRDLRPYLFLGAGSPYPMMPNKRNNWRSGFISQYNGLREMGRYAKYHNYGYDMSLVKDDLSTGYWQATAYLLDHFEPEKQKLGLIYQTIAQLIDADDFDQMVKASKEIDYKDALDEIMEALE